MKTWTLCIGVLATACTLSPAGPGELGGASGEAGDDSSSEPANTTSSTTGSSTDSSGETIAPPLYDLAVPDAPIACDEAVPHEPCDDTNAGPFAAMGINCPGEPELTVLIGGPAAAIGTRQGFGATALYDPQEGTSFAVIGSGPIAELDSETPDEDGMLGHSYPTYCEHSFGTRWDPGTMLPFPLRTTDVGPQTCAEDPTLVGTGDCSNTIQAQFEQGVYAADYVDLRINGTVPEGATALEFDFAFFSTEYPFYFETGYNDMFIGWLESSAWTGNVSFDGEGNPISLNATFLQYVDVDGDLPELDGTCMRYHASTGWLTTSVGVTPGEPFTLVLAIFDLSDSRLDSYVFLDNFRWGCGEGGPATRPAG